MNGDIAVTFIELFPLLKLLLATTLGAFTLYVLHRHQDKQPFSLFRAINIDVISKSAQYRTILADMFFSSLLGATIVFLLTSPTTVPQAIIAGLGMTGILSANTKDVGIDKS